MTETSTPHQIPIKSLTERITNSPDVMRQCSILLKKLNFVYFQLRKGELLQYIKINAPPPPLIVVISRGEVGSFNFVTKQPARYINFQNRYTLPSKWHKLFEISFIYHVRIFSMCNALGNLLS
jgi:hypothetical protein